jgi:uncharacterized coiled-coil protein SlyX
MKNASKTPFSYLKTPQKRHFSPQNLQFSDTLASIRTDHSFLTQNLRTLSLKTAEKDVLIANLREKMAENEAKMAENAAKMDENCAKLRAELR